MKRLFVFAVLALLTTAVGLEIASAASRRKKLSAFVYVHEGTGKIFAYEWAQDGQLTDVPGSPFDTGLPSPGCGGCQTLAYSPKRKTLVATGNSGMRTFIVEKDGSLTGGAGGGPYLPDDNPVAVEVVDRGKQTFAYVNTYHDEEIRSFLVNDDGSLTEFGLPVATGTGPNGLVVVKKKVLVVANEEGNSLSSFLIGKDGSLTEAPGSPLAFDTSFTWRLELGPRGKRVYAGEHSGTDVFGFDVDFKTGALTPVSDTPFTSALDGTGSGVSAARRGPAIVTSYVSASAQAVKVGRRGSLTPLGEPQTLATGASSSHARSPNRKFMVIANRLATSVYRVDRKSGKLTLVTFVEKPSFTVDDVQVVRR